MPQEPISNIGFVCPDHEPKPGRYKGHDPKDFIGLAVKLGFPHSGGKAKEHMWVIVTGLGKETQLEGILDNDPVLVEDYDCGDGVGFDVEEIEEVDHEPS